jgi:hypothetical protein
MLVAGVASGFSRCCFVTDNNLTQKQKPPHREMALYIWYVILIKTAQLSTTTHFTVIWIVK